jgi:hypothetical protein
MTRKKNVADEWVTAMAETAAIAEGKMAPGAVHVVAVKPKDEVPDPRTGKDDVSKA